MSAASPLVVERTFSFRVVVESPYSGDVARNLRYARACMRDCLNRGESPIASHLLYTQPGILDDANPEERQWGIEAGFAWNTQAHITAVYTDLGISSGMHFGIAHANRQGRGVEYRSLPEWKADARRTPAYEQDGSSSPDYGRGEAG